LAWIARIAQSPTLAPSLAGKPKQRAVPEAGAPNAAGTPASGTAQRAKRISGEIFAAKARLCWVDG